ncbi:MAG TPA: ATP-binding cassette domain-containing protein [Dongiaceae bacterium]|nr:ATP-binding cassette domain-containing protein [Dongiaceae bacterium]
MIQFEGVSKRFERSGRQTVTAIQDLSLTISRGEIFGIIGRSGAGKSTLIRLVNGLEKADSGQVLVDGVDIATLSARDLRRERRKIGMIFQHFNLLSARSVFDNVALPLELAHSPRAEILRRVERLLALVELSDKADRYPSELSGGQRQRVGIARALATDPGILLSDEATSALDPETTQSILGLLERVNAELGVTILLITHQMSVIKAICHRVGVIEDGRIIEQGSVFDIFTRPAAATTKSFVGAIDTLPQNIAASLQLAGGGTGSRQLQRWIVSGKGLEMPLISRLARDGQIDIPILHGQMDRIGGQAIGIFIVSLPVQVAQAPELRHFLAANDVMVEDLGHVA